MNRAQGADAIDVSSLFQPFRIKSLQLKNRVVMAPMTRSFSPNGLPPREVAAYYRRRAEGEVGFIVTEGVGVDRPASRNEPDVPNFFGDALPAWKDIVDGVHAAGGTIAPQLWHVGSSRNRTKEWTPPGPFESPSGCNSLGDEVGVALSDATIGETIDAFTRSAAEARRMGFDALELHGAHGYLIDQFFWPRTNRRNDRWGGTTIPERARFAAELVRSIRGAIGDDMPLIFRFSQFKLEDYQAKVAETPEEMRQWLEPLAEAGVDMFHCSQRRFWEPEFPGSDLNLAGWAKKLTGKPTITVGSVGLSGEFIAGLRGRETSEPAAIGELLKRLEREEFDLVAVGRALLADANWAAKVHSGRSDELNGYEFSATKTLS